MLQRGGPDSPALSAADAAGEVLLQSAVRMGAMDVVAALCRCGAPADAVDSAGNGPLHAGALGSSNSSPPPPPHPHPFCSLTRNAHRAPALWLRDPDTRGAALRELLLAGAYAGDWDKEVRRGGMHACTPPLPRQGSASAPAGREGDGAAYFPGWGCI